MLASRRCCLSGTEHAIASSPAVRNSGRAVGEAGQGSEKPVRTDSGTMMRFSPSELAFLAPRLRNYLRSTELN